MELFFDVTLASKGVIWLSIPQLQSEAKYPISLVPGLSNTSLILQINQVRPTDSVTAVRISGQFSYRTIT